MATSTSVVRARRGFANVALRLIPAEHRAAAWYDVTELGFAVFGFLLYFLVRGGVVGRAADALAHTRSIASLEFSVGMFWEPGIQHWVLSSAWLLTLCNFAYFWFDFPLIVAVGLVLFWRRRPTYMLLRDSLLTSGGLALLVYWTFPVAPPRFLSEWGFIDTLAKFSNLSYQAQSMRPFVNPFAAVPSLHVGWSLLLLMAVFHATRLPLWRAAMIAVFLLQLIAVIATGNHLIFDGIVGIAICLIGLWLTQRMHQTGYPAVRRLLHSWARHPEARRDAAAPAGR